jgi:hypothetical protein
VADIVYKTVALPPGYLNVPYEAGVSVFAATAMTAGGVSTGALPTGLVVNATDHMRITGTPTVAGLYTFTLTMTDTAGAVVSGSYTIYIGPPTDEPQGVRSLADQLRIQWPGYGT